MNEPPGGNVPAPISLELLQAISKEFKGGVPPQGQGYQGVIFMLPPGAGTVIVNLAVLFADKDFQKALKLHREAIAGFGAGIGKYGARQSEVVIELGRLPTSLRSMPFGNFPAAASKLRPPCSGIRRRQRSLRCSTRRRAAPKRNSEPTGSAKKRCGAWCNACSRTSNSFARSSACRMTPRGRMPICPSRSRLRRPEIRLWASACALIGRGAAPECATHNRGERGRSPRDCGARLRRGRKHQSRSAGASGQPLHHRHARRLSASVTALRRWQRRFRPKAPRSR